MVKDYKKMWKEFLLNNYGSLIWILGFTFILYILPESPDKIHYMFYCAIIVSIWLTNLRG